MDALGITSVVLNGLSSIALIRLPDKLNEYTSDGQWNPPGATFGELVVDPAEISRNIRRHHFRKALYAIAAISLAIGIALQILDLARS